MVRNTGRLKSFNVRTLTWPRAGEASGNGTIVMSDSYIDKAIHTSPASNPQYGLNISSSHQMLIFNISELQESLESHGIYRFGYAKERQSA